MATVKRDNVLSADVMIEEMYTLFDEYDLALRVNTRIFFFLLYSAKENV